jgi:hypothetical protein
MPENSKPETCRPVHKRLLEAAPKAKEFLSMHPLADELVKLCHSKGWKASIVGGFPRDMLFGKKINDVDVVIESCGDIQDLAAGMNSLGFGKAKEKGTFDKHFDLVCNDTAFSIFRAENTYGGEGKEKATAKDVVSAFDFSMNAFVIDLPKVEFSDPLGVAVPTFDEGAYYILPTNRVPCINNRARTILRGLKLGAKFPEVWLDELSELWMTMNQRHIRKISVEDFDHILGSLDQAQKSSVMRRYETIRFFELCSHTSRVRKAMSKLNFEHYMKKYGSEPRKLIGNLSGYATVPFDHGQVMEEVEAHDTYFDTHDGLLSGMGLTFRIKDKKRRCNGSEPFIEISLISKRFAFEDGLVVKQDDFTKLTQEQRKELLSSMDPFQLKELEPVATLLKTLSKRGINLGSLKLKPVRRTVTETRTVVFQHPSIPNYTPFQDPKINDVAPDIGQQIEIKFNRLSSVGKEVCYIELSAPPFAFNIMNAADLFPGTPTEKTKLQLVSE